MRLLLDLYEKILKDGEDKNDRTGVGTRSIFGHQMRFDLSKGFPAITTKKLAWKSVIGELLWFIEGSNDNHRLSEITYGNRENKTIWSDNAYSSYWKPSAQFDGDLGRIYGVQWRKWNKSNYISNSKFDDFSFKNEKFTTSIKQENSIDQLLTLIYNLKNDPSSRRHILTAWNPAELNLMALPPCHCFSQFMVTNNKLSCLTYIRSNDLFLGAPFNIASYSLLTHMLAQVCNYSVGELIYTIGDAHIYKNHFPQVIHQLLRKPYDLPTLKINSETKNILDFKIDDFELINYNYHSAIKAEMAV